MGIDVLALIPARTAALILAQGLELATALRLPVSSWRTGDPTGTLYQYAANVLATNDAVQEDFIRGGYLSKARGDWLTLLASDVFGVDREEGSPSTPKVTLHNTGGGEYPIEIGGLTVKASSSGVTFHNTSAGTLHAGGTVTFDLVCDVDGSDGTVAEDEIDEMVTTLLGVEITDSDASIGIDEQDDDSLIQDCLDSRGSISPNGPPDAYEYVVRQFKLTGVRTITRSRATRNSSTGLVKVYCGGPSGGVDGPSVTAAQTAIAKYTTPLTITATAYTATADETDIEADISGTDLPAGATALCTAALQTRFAKLKIANDSGGTVPHSLIESAIQVALEAAGATDVSVDVTTPPGDVAYAEGHVPTIGDVAINE